jgi:aspartate carbamoyltransferase regulatory subunit
VIDKLVKTVSDGKCSVQVERVVMDKQDIGSVAVVHPTSALEIFKSMWLQTKPLFQRPNLFLTIVACLSQFCLYAR